MSTTSRLIQNPFFDLRSWRWRSDRGTQSSTSHDPLQLRLSSTGASQQKTKWAEYVAALRAPRRGSVLESQNRSQVDGCVDQRVADFSQKLFGGDVKIHKESDPEFDYVYFVVSVKARGTVEELLALNHAWHLNIGQVAGESADQYRLSLDLQ